MKNLTMTAAAAALTLCVAGCITVQTPAPPAPVTVQLFNATGRDVRPNLYISGSASTEDGLFVGGNVVTNFTDRAFGELRAGETVTLDYECDAIRSVGSDLPVAFDAAALDLDLSGDRVFLARDVNYECGGTVRLVFYYDGTVFRVRSE